MLDIAAIGLALCLNTGVINCDEINYEYDSSMKRDGVNGVTLLYKNSGKQLIRVSSQYKNNEHVLKNILVHELAHAHAQQQGKSLNHNRRHLKVFKDACKTLTTNLKTTDRNICKKEANYG